MKDWCAAGSCCEEKEKELQVGINAHLFITNVLRHCGWRLFHGNKRQDLQQMILHHVSETANSCLLYWAKEMAPWPTEDKLHPSPAYVDHPMHILLQLIVSPDPKTSSIPFSSLRYHPIPKPTVYPSLAYIIPWSPNQQFILLHPTLSQDPQTAYPAPAYIISWSPKQQFILLQPTLSPDPQNNSLSCSILHYPLILKPTVYPAPSYIIPWSQKRVYPVPAYIIPWSQNQQFIFLQPTLSPDPKTAYPSPAYIIPWSQNQ